MESFSKLSLANAIMFLPLQSKQEADSGFSKSETSLGLLEKSALRDLGDVLIAMSPEVTWARVEGEAITQPKDIREHVNRF